jgi:hypothetical protein
MACHTQSGLIGSASIIVVARKRRRDARVAGAGCGDPYVEFRRYGSVLRELERREPINRGRYHIQVRLKRVLRTEGSAAGIGRDTPDAGSEGIVSSSDRVPGLQNTFQCCGW